MASLFCQRKHRKGSETRDMLIGESQSSFHEEQFKKWIFDWELRVFKNRLLTPKRLTYFYSPEQYHLISELVESYHKRHKEQVSQDIFVWTTFACSIITDHQQHTQMHGYRREKCQINRCMYVLLWVGYYLRLRYSEVVKEMLREIVRCTGNLRFMFSFLPGMSIRLYTLLLWEKPPLFEETLCKEYFIMIDEQESLIIMSCPSTQCRDIFRHSQPFLLYLIQHLTPLHTHFYSGPITLVETLNKAILPDMKYSLLTLSTHYHDQALVKTLLELGASADILYNGNDSSAERMMVTTVIKMIEANQFFKTTNDRVFRKVMDDLIKKVGLYAPQMRRSVFRSEQRISNIWDSEYSTHELNREIADVWGIECETPCPTLQHICRMRIRQQILETDRVLLSEAIMMLPLPNKMIQYLNLQCD